MMVVYYLVGIITGLLINRLLWTLRRSIEIKLENIEYLKRKANENEDQFKSGYNLGYYHSSIGSKNTFEDEA